MDTFKSEVRIRILSLNGLDEELLAAVRGEEIPGLDAAIIKLAGENISSIRDLTAFALAFKCVPSWEEICEIYLKNFPSPIDEETVQRYARNGKSKLYKKPSLPKVAEWKPKTKTESK